ncbi:MAG: carboxylating nicotinate-nucleotide diphosphorylase [Chloroflexota bacterium]
MTEQSLPEAQVNAIVSRALTEDTCHGDITSDLLLPVGLYGEAAVGIKAAGVLAGGEIAAAVFRQVDPDLAVSLLVPDGTPVQPGDTVMTVSGKVSGILTGERTALNFLQRLSGIASLTARYVAAVAGTTARIYDTRKTTPGLRLLEKYAVRAGGGTNHRRDLGDGILIKDNHLAAAEHLGMGLAEAVRKAKQGAPSGVKVEVEVTTPEAAADALAAGADIIMLDNMTTAEMRRAVAMVGGKAKIEASGGITLDNVRAVALTGVDIISVGALTHSYRSLDISLELEPDTLKLL